MSTQYTQSPPGVVIDHVPASTESYVGSPSIVALSDGSYVATHDLFGPGTTYNTSRVFRSTDRGETWSHATDLEEAFWGGLFVHRDVLYLMGCSGRFGSMVIRKSEDGGSTWSQPKDPSSGLLRDDGMYHTAPMPVVEHDGRLWRAMEDMYPTVKWGVNFRALIASADADKDLLSADSWTLTNPVACNTAWLDSTFGGWLEGNAVVNPAGGVVDMLRVDYREGDGEYAAIVSISEDGREAGFREEDFVRFPGGCKKFSVRKDPVSDGYWTLSNIVAPGFEEYNVERTRNTLALMRSKDLRDWTIASTVLHHEKVENHAFQYVDWQFDGDDIIVASRTAFDDGLGGAHNQHDANFLTFHRIHNFRSAHEKN